MKIAVCTVGSKCLAVLRVSLMTYAPEHDLALSGPDGVGMIKNTGKNFGDSYNELLDVVFQTESECIVANDDVVVNQHTIPRLLEDVAGLKAYGIKLGWVGARSDYVLPQQNVRMPLKDDKFENLRFSSESLVKEATVIAPIFAYVSREAFQQAKFPPINWYTDNVSCDDMTKLGYRHFVSRAYVHHVGGDSTGQDFNKLIAEAGAWMWPNRPEYAAKYGLPKPAGVL